VLLSVVPLAIGFVVATGLALLAHRYTFLNAWFLALVSALFTVPSIAFYLILLNVTGRGFATAVVVLTAYTLVLIYRNVATGLQEVPRDMVDAAEGMGLTRRQILFRVELLVLLATVLELIVLVIQRAATPWERAVGR
jgi:osmoprotectant transport system permease protein